MKTTVRAQSSRQSGFSLIEILVGMAIGMLGIIVMMQVFAVSEERKRTTNAGSDAQGNAALALDGMRREILRGGYGFAGNRLLSCNLQLPNGAPVPLAPVIVNPPAAVIPPGDPNTDTLLVAYGSSDDQPEGYQLNLPPPPPPYTLLGTGPMRANDWVIPTPPPPSPTAACALPTLSLQRVTAVAGPVVTTTGPNVATATALFNLGAAPRFLAYAVRNGNLTVCDYMAADCGAAIPLVGTTPNPDPAIWRPMANNVVSLRAEYGRDTSAPMNGTADVFDQTAPTTNCGWARTSAVRLALVARSAQFEKEDVTPAAPQWQGTGSATPVLLNVSQNPDGSANALWQRYRYRVFETLVPLRNVAWMGVPQGC